jgi:flagellar biogenesis protein FliO
MHSIVHHLLVAPLTLIVALVWVETAYGDTPATQPLISWHADEAKPAAPPPVQPAPVMQDPEVAIAEFAEPVTSANSADPRRLAPPSEAVQLPRPKSFSAGESLPFDFPHADSLTTAVAGLAIVLGLFLLCAWLVRRSGPKPTTPLPRDAVAVLGRTPLAGHHFAHLVQVGNKLVLVSIGPDGARPLAEVTEPLEVHRLLGMCLRNHKQSSTAEFHSVLEQLAREGGRGFLGNEAAGAYARAGRT